MKTATCSHPCSHPADKASTEALLLTCPDCGAECSQTQIGDDRLCYDQACPLHVMAGEVAAPDGYNVYRFDDERDETKQTLLGTFPTLDEAHQFAQRNGGHQVQRGLDGEVTNLQAERGRDVQAQVNPVTDAQIKSLRLEARAAGDEAQVALCEQALNGDAAARAECAAAIAGR